MVTYDPSSKTAPITQYGNPAQYGSLYPSTSGNTIQQIIVGDDGYFYSTQSKDGTPNSVGYNTTIITRYQGPNVSHTKNSELDSMTIINGGHGMGLDVRGGTVWISLQGENTQNAVRGGVLYSFKYTAGSYNISKIPGGIKSYPMFTNNYGEKQESIYNWDNKGGYVVERMFDFHTGNQERYTRRRISDDLAGVDAPVGQIVVPTNPPTTQGFTTIGDTLFRWLGISNGAPNGQPGQMVASDPMACEAWDWNTGQKIGYKVFSTLGQTNSTPGQLWISGQYEPEGASVFNESDGTQSLVVAVVVGIAPNHRYPIYKFIGIGQPVA